MTGTSLDPRLGQLWRTARAPLLICLLVLLVATGVALHADQRARGLLDPAAVDGPGSGALAELLRRQGVDIRVVRHAAEVRAAGPRSTVFVAFPRLLTPDQQAAVRASAADLVVVAPGAGPLAPAEVVGQAPVRSREPGCPLPDARAAGAADLGGELYRPARSGTAACYPHRGGGDGGDGGSGDGGAALAVVPDGQRSVTLVGAPDPFTNDALADNGNAALALRLLGQHRELLWYLPAPEAAAGQQRSLVDLVPGAWYWGAVQLAVGALVVVLWRARRLGPVVAEPLPVVVRAAETVEGRGRLYRRAGARAHAARVLREAALHRLRELLGLAPGADPAAVLDAVATRSGRPPAAVQDLLYGAAPGDDAALVRLADELDAVEREVRRS